MHRKENNPTLFDLYIRICVFAVCITLVLTSIMGCDPYSLLCVQNREMHDQMDYFLGGHRSNSYLSSERNPQIVYR